MKFLILLALMLLVSCASDDSLVIKNWRKSPSVMINGAKIFSKVQSLKGEGMVQREIFVYRAATHNFDGPLRWQFLAEGSEGTHRSMRIEEVQISTSLSKRDEKLPISLLGIENTFTREQQAKSKSSWFKKASDKAPSEKDIEQPRWIASYVLPEILQLYPKADGKVVVAAKIAITTADGESVEWVNFALIPNLDRSKSYKFRQTMIEYDGVPIE